MALKNLRPVACRHAAAVLSEGAGTLPADGTAGQGIMTLVTFEHTRSHIVAVNSVTLPISPGQWLSLFANAN